MPRAPTRGPCSGRAVPNPRVVGPSSVKPLVGRLFGRPTAVLLAGEAHEDVIDLTRRKAVCEPQMGWVERVGGRDPNSWPRPAPAIPRSAKEWAAAWVEEHGDDESSSSEPGSRADDSVSASDESDPEDDEATEDSPEGVYLVFQPELQAAEDGAGSQDGAVKTAEVLRNRKGVVLGTATIVIDSGDDPQGSFEKQFLVAEEEDHEEEEEDETKRSSKAPEEVRIFEFADLDPDARVYNKRRLHGETVSNFEHDLIIAKRKQEHFCGHSNVRAAKGNANANASKKKKAGGRGGAGEGAILLFDDWLRQQLDISTVAAADPGTEEAPYPRLHVVLEAPVRPGDVELCRSAVEYAPSLASPAVQGLAADGDQSEADDDDPDDGTGTFLGYLERRLLDGEGGEEVETPYSEFVSCVETRDLGSYDLEEVELKQKLLSSSVNNKNKSNLKSKTVLSSSIMCMSSALGFREMAQQHAAALADADFEEQWLSSSTRGEVVGEGSRSRMLPSWEGFFGCAAELLYYSPEVQVSFVPFLTQCLGGDFDTVLRFFDRLYFGEVAEAVQLLHLGGEGGGGADLRHTYIRSKLLLSLPDVAVAEVGSAGSEFTASPSSAAVKRAAGGEREPAKKRRRAAKDGKKSTSADKSRTFAGGPSGSQEPELPALSALQISEPRAPVRRPSNPDQESLVPMAHDIRDAEFAEKVRREYRKETLAVLGMQTPEVEGGTGTEGKKLLQRASAGASSIRAADVNGDYFAAYLREVHPEIWHDVDHSDCRALAARKRLQSISNGRKKHDVRERVVKMPETGEEALRNMTTGHGGGGANNGNGRKSRVMASILIDAFQCKLVDAAMLLAIGKAVQGKKQRKEEGVEKEHGENIKEGEKIVIVVYGGSEHTDAVAKFLREQYGFQMKGKTIGKEDYEEDESRVLEFPEHLRDLRKLFE
eukprot:g8959.t1